MSELILPNKQATDFGSRFDGTVETANSSIPVSWFESGHLDRTGAVYIMAAGLGTTRASMAVAAEEAVRANCAALVFDYTNTGAEAALDHNTADFMNVASAVPDGARRRAIGLSMGGVVALRGTAQTVVPIESISTVASAGFLPREVNGWLEVALHFAAATPEFKDIFIKDPLRAMSLAVSSAQHGRRRAPAIRAELGELVHCNEQATVHQIKNAPNAPYMRFRYGDRDFLFPRWAQEAGVEGLPFDEILMYKGGHTALVHDRRIAQTIFEHDTEIFTGTPVPAAA